MDSVRKYLNQHRLLKWILVYTLVFSVTALLVFIWFIINHKSFIFVAATDGLVQHFNSFVYYGKWLREIINTLLSSGQFIIPQFDLAIGYGSDVITTFTFYALGDPLYLLSIFSNPGNSETLYMIIIIIRFYLSGLFFGLYCRSKGKQGLPVICGCLIYAFCGFALFYGTRHVFFINAMIYLPLILWGVDLIYQKKNPSLFVISIALAGLTNYYFFYMLVIMTIVYAIVEYFNYVKEKRLKNLIPYILRFIGYGLLGVGIAAVLLVPVGLASLDSARVGTEQAIPWFYPLKDYLWMIIGFTSIQDHGTATILGFTTISLLSLLLLVKAKGHKNEKIFLAICIISLCLPIIGSMMNVFLYPFNRWCFAFAFLVAYISVDFIPELVNLDKKDRVYLLILMSLYVIFIAVFSVLFSKAKLSALVSNVLPIIIVVLVIWLINKFKYKHALGLVLLVTILSISSVSYLWYQKGRYINNYVNRGSAYAALDNAPEKEIKSLTDNELVRYDHNTYNESVLYNENVFHNVYGLSSYFSMGNQNVSTFLAGQNTIALDMEHAYKGVDNSSYLDNILGVKYFIVKQGNEQYLPYGYDKLVKKSGDYSIYESSLALPFGYVYDETFSEDVFLKLDPVNQQNVMSLYGVTEDGEVKTIDSIVSNEVTIENPMGIEISDGKYQVSKKNSDLVVEISGAKDQETYLTISGLTFKAKKELSSGKKNKRGSKVRNLLWAADKDRVITVKAGKITKTFALRAPNSAYYSSNADFTINLGRDIPANTKVTISFSDSGEYGIDTVSYSNIDLSDLETKLDALKQNSLQNVEYTTNKITGEITMDKEGLLCLSTPYSTGWMAYVDGKKVSLEKVNTIQMGLWLESGTHQIKLVYETPGLKVGTVISLASTLTFVVILILRKRRNKTKEILK